MRTRTPFASRATRSFAPCGIVTVSQPLPRTRIRSSHTAMTAVRLHLCSGPTPGPHSMAP